MYSDKQKIQIVAKVFDQMVNGVSVNEIFKAKSMPRRSTFYKWLIENPAFSDNYAMVLRQRADMLFDDMLQIADTPLEGITTKIMKDGAIEITKADMLGHRKLQIDARKWVLAKMNPKKYGDRVINDNNNRVVEPEMTKEEREKELAEIFKKAKKG